MTDSELSEKVARYLGPNCPRPPDRAWYSFDHAYQIKAMLDECDRCGWGVETDRFEEERSCGVVRSNAEGDQFVGAAPAWERALAEAYVAAVEAQKEQGDG